MLTLTTVKTGVQAAVATGSARKKDINWAAGGIGAVMVGGLIGGHQNTDMAKMTAAALLDAFNKLIPTMPATPVSAVAPPSKATQ